jgi:mono/diheme cytochrome c family protein
MKKILLASSIALGLACISFKVLDDQPKKPWIVPDKSTSMKNPVASNSESVANGKELWGTQCKSCHGNKGLGDGSKAAQLKTDPGDFSKADEQSQSDGSMFYKISEGRDDMPSFKKKIPDQSDVWSLVNYIRTFKK